VREVAGAYAGDYLGMLGRAVFRRIETFPKIVVAAVGGVCVGGGLELALACDLVVVAETAQLSEPHVTLHSFTAGEGLTNTLARLVGVQKAKELVLLGGTVDGREAVRIGLANRVVPEGSLAAEAGKIAAAVAGLDPVAARMAKVLANAAPDIDRERGLRLDALVRSMQMTMRGGGHRGAVKFSWPSASRTGEDTRSRALAPARRVESTGGRARRAGPHRGADGMVATGDRGRPGQAGSGWVGWNQGPFRLLDFDLVFLGSGTPDRGHSAGGIQASGRASTRAQAPSPPMIFSAPMNRVNRVSTTSLSTRFSRISTPFPSSVLCTG
jgi:hypothetical protein